MSRIEKMTFPDSTPALEGHGTLWGKLAMLPELGTKSLRTGRLPHPSRMFEQLLGRTGTFPVHGNVVTRAPQRWLT